MLDLTDYARDATTKDHSVVHSLVHLLDRLAEGHSLNISENQAFGPAHRKRRCDPVFLGLATSPSNVHETRYTTHSMRTRLGFLRSPHMISFSPTLESAWVRFCLLLRLWWLESSCLFGTVRSSPVRIDAEAPDMSDRLPVELLVVLDDTDWLSGTLAGWEGSTGADSGLASTPSIECLVDDAP